MNLSSRPINQVLACLAIGLTMVLVLFAAGGGGARAHEIRPAIVDLTFPGNSAVQLDMSLILEAALAEIGVEHSDTDDSPNAPPLR